MEVTFEKMLKEGKATVEGLVQWIKDAKLITWTKENEEKGRALIEEFKEKNKEEIDKISDIVINVVEDPKKSLESLTEKISEECPKVIHAVSVGVNAFKDALAGSSKK